jgi:hypothetical protein
MKLKDILAISGKPGLYKFLSQGRNGIIVESISDKKRTAINSATKVSALSDIAIYTETEEMPLKEVLKKLYEKESGKQTISHKSENDQLVALFEQIVPDFDRNRVYVSDIRKLIAWYNVLIEHNLIDPNEEDEVPAQTQEEENNQEKEITADSKEKPTKASEEKTKSGKIDQGKKPAKKAEDKTDKPKAKAKPKKEE